MTNHELLDAIGNARDTYLMQTQFYREYRVPEPEIKGFPLKRLLLIAAILALTLALVGCTVVYVLSLQEMRVGEHTEPQTNAAREEKTTTLVSLQGVHQPALMEWLTFLDSYDREKKLLTANDRNQSGVPEPYHLVYGCYTWEMVEKLDEIIEAYDLKLLEPSVAVQAEESLLLLDALGLERLHHTDSGARVEYGGGYFYPEGTFQISLYVTLPGWERGALVDMRYSLQEYFDPVYGSLEDIDSYTQWIYTTQSEIPVLLAKNPDHARIYANLSHAFVSIHTGEPLTQEALEQLADVFDLRIRPRYADAELVKRKQATFAAEAEAARKEAAARDAELFAKGMENYAAYRYGQEESLCFSSYDLNGDGLEELIIRDPQGCCYEVVSRNPAVNGGQAYLYLDTLLAMPQGTIHPCPDSRDFALIHEGDAWIKYAFYRAEPDQPVFREAVHYSKGETQWYYLPDDDPWTQNEAKISQRSAEDILSRYPFGDLPQTRSLLDFVQTDGENVPTEEPG